MIINYLCNSTRHGGFRTLHTIKDGGVRKFLFLPAVSGHCLCDNSRNNVLMHRFRVHSSLSETRRQKVVLETTAAPKILLEKLPSLGEKVLPVEKNGSFSSLRIKVDDVRGTIDPYVKLMRIDKPIGTWLLFWPCSWSISMASAACCIPPNTAVYNLALFLAGSFIMRGAGCTINDMWDKDIDGRVERTKDRPLVAGTVTERQALIFLATQLCVGLAILLQLNWYSIVLGASSLLLVVTYPLAKRFTNYPQLFLGATFNWGALLGWTAIQGGLEPLVCLPLYFGALCWTVVYDTIYAHQDKNDDARIGIKSTALTFGEHTKPLLTLAGVGAVTGLAVAGANVGLDWSYYVALGAAAAHQGKQIYTLDPENPTDCACKFKSNSLVGLIIFLGILGGGYNMYTNGRRKHNTDNV